jgi:probable F420-dependent oxidoreductase
VVARTAHFTDRRAVQIGVVYPQNEIESDRGAVRQFALSVENMGFTHVQTLEHVINVNAESRPGWNMPFDIGDPFHEPFVLFSFMAGVTSNLGFITGVLILTQRQTVLVAKQAACLDVLCEGRFRLGVGTGWNEVEYEALGVPFAGRGARIEEQVELLRALWSNPSVTVNTELHTITDAGLTPLPVQRPIPVWFGGGSDRRWINGGDNAKLPALRRIARIADGWVPEIKPDDRGRELIDTMHEMARECGRDPATIGIEGRMYIYGEDPQAWVDDLKRWEEMGASHVAVNTHLTGVRGVDEHVRKLAKFREAVPAASFREVTA